MEDLRTISTRVCHDLYSPINTVRMALSLLGDASNCDAASQAELLSTARWAMDELTEVVKKLRLVTEASTSEPERAQVDMQSCFDRSVHVLQAMGLGRENEIARPAHWPHVVAVPAWTQEICSIFLRNAFEHGGSKVNVVISWERRSDRFRFSVRDDGVGVDKSLRHTLFRPFENLHRHYDGRGLGLSIASRLAELQGGRCGYQPVSPTGSLFYFELPQSQTLDRESERSGSLRPGGEAAR